MKILIISNASIVYNENGFFVFRSDEVSQYLQKQGHTIEFFQFRSKSQSDICTLNLKEQGFRVTTVERSKFKIIDYFFAYLLGIWRALNNDFIYIYYPNHFRWIGLFVKLFGKEYGFYLRGSKNIENKSSSLLYKYAKIVFCVSPSFTKIVNKAGGYGVLKKPTIPFTYNDVCWNRQYTTKKHYSVLYLGRIDYDKGLLDLLYAVKILSDEQVFFKLKIIGSGNALEGLKKKCAELNINQNVDFLGAILEKEEIKSAYLNADIYVLPTYHEGFARTLFEAMIFGTPIITTLVGGIPGFMRDEYNCVMIEPKSATSIAQKLLFAMNNYENMVEYARNGLKTVSDILDPKMPSHGEQLHKIITGEDSAE